MQSKRPRHRILFIAEGATLAHVSRPAVLAQALDASRYEIHVARPARYEFLFNQNKCQQWPLNSISSEQFLAALAAGRPVYDYETLAAYAEEDERLIANVRPDIVLGDFRLSLSVSARMTTSDRPHGVPYFAITNAYWSPYARPTYTVPTHASVRMLGPTIANLGFALTRSLFFRAHTKPLNRLRKQFGMPPLPSLEAVYTDADVTLYADVPGMIPTYDLPTSHHYIGPLSWSPTTTYPSWWNTLDDTRPIIYATPGSSGDTGLLTVVIDALKALPVSAMVATAGRTKVVSDNPYVHVSDYLPGMEAAARSKLVICNGGSPTAAQALINGVPVLGIASNLDQYLNMGYVEKMGAGRVLRA